jgi:hypothetical protein
VKNPFARDNEVDEPGIVGARWWNNAVVESAATQGRRVALAVLAASVVGVVGLCTVAAVGVASSDDDEREEARPSVKLQQDYGWNFDVPTQTVTFDAAHTKEYVRSALVSLVDDLAPSRADLAPFYVPTLFQSPEALPKVQLPDGSNANIRPIAEALRPIRMPSMVESQARGKALAELLARATRPVAVIVDLDGPDAVAFAAGMAQTHDVVSLFDNWPHPQGVVKAHLTLAAAVFHQPDFRETKAKRPSTAPPLFVLDRARLAAYTDSPTQFDNRWTAKLPPAASLVNGLGYKDVLYVVPAYESTLVKADLAPTLSAYRDAGATVRALAAGAFETSTGAPAYYGGTAERNETFLSQYGWGSAPATGSGLVPLTNEKARDWRPQHAANLDPSLAAIGVTTVAVALGTGYVLRRSGTWNRAPSGGWGGG